MLVAEVGWMGFSRGYFADTPNFPSPLVEFKDAGGEWALICPICCLGTAHSPALKNTTTQPVSVWVWYSYDNPGAYTTLKA